MPRPSLKDQRSAEILDAYLSCVVRFGLEGATQERIAKEADVKRPLLRHYLGNKDEMQLALLNHVVEQYSQITETLADWLKQAKTPSDVVELLFPNSNGNRDDLRLMVAAQALAVQADADPKQLEALRGSQKGFLDMLSAALRAVTTRRDQHDLAAVSQGVTAILSAQHALDPLNPPADWAHDLKRAAAILVAQLETLE